MSISPARITSVAPSATTQHRHVGEEQVAQVLARRNIPARRRRARRQRADRDRDGDFAAVGHRFTGRQMARHHGGTEVRASPELRAAASSSSASARICPAASPPSRERAGDRAAAASRAMRSLMPRISGSSDEIIRIASPASRRGPASARESPPSIRRPRPASARRGSAPTAASPASAPAPPSAGCRPTACTGSVVDRRRLDPQPLDERCAAARSALAVDQARARDTAREVREARVRGDRHLEHDAVLAAILGQVRRCRARSRRPATSMRTRPRRSTRISPLSAGVRPNRISASSRAARSDQPRERRRSRRVGPTATRRSPASRLRQMPRSSSADLADRATGASETPPRARVRPSAESAPAAIHLARAAVATTLAVAQHGDAIGDREHLLEPVRDVDDAAAPRRAAGR